MIITAIGAGICLYLAADLYQTLASYARAPERDYIFVYALVGIASLFSLATVAFWFFPWSWATMNISQTGIEISVTGLGAFPKTQFPWARLATITVVILPRGASVIHIFAKDGTGRTVRTWALKDDPNAYLMACAKQAQSAGYSLNGPDLNAPILGKRSWTVQRAV